jgi:hypothetical protein
VLETGSLVLIVFGSSDVGGAQAIVIKLDTTTFPRCSTARAAVLVEREKTVLNCRKNKHGTHIAGLFLANPRFLIPIFTVETIDTLVSSQLILNT